MPHMAAQGRTVERVLAQIAGGNHGVVTRDQLVVAEISRHEVARCVKSGALLREYRGVYRVGHRAPSVESSYLAAVRACGEGALLSDSAAAYLYGLIKGQPPPAEVTTPTQRSVQGLRTRRAKSGIDRRDATTYRGIQITTVPKTIVDLAAVLSPGDLARAVHEAAVRHRIKPQHVEAVLRRRPNAPGATALRRVLRGDERVLLSELERAFIALLRANDLPLPVTNRKRGAHWVDCRWPDRKLTIELDSYTFHHTRHAWEQDRRRERDAHARGDDFRRYTWGDVFERPAATAAELIQLLITLPS
jgi:predicted transcriptional regulator of viral defense system